MFKKLIITFSVLLIVGWTTFFVVIAKRTSLEQSINQSINQPKLTLFYGLGCPHCAKVEDYIHNNTLRKSIVLEEKEVYHNKDNQMLLIKTAKNCGLPTDQVGVPLLWNGSQCIVGDEPIIDYLQNKI